MDPFNLTAGPFLWLYGGLFGLALLASLWLPRWLRPEGHYAAQRETDRLAYLAGGPARFTDSVIARLYTQGSVSVDPKRGLTMRAAPSAGGNGAEIAVLGLPSPSRYSAVCQALRPHAELTRQRLSEAGVLVDAVTGWQLRFWQSLPLLLVLLFGTARWQIGTLRDKPVGILGFFLLVTLAALIIRLVVLDRRTVAGLAVLDRARQQHERLRRAAASDEAALAVALFGTGVLAGSAWSNLDELRRAASGDSGGGGDSSGDSGGDGGCGGGCGGCGG